MSSGIFDGADEVTVEERRERGDRKYLNKCPGQHTLTIIRNEITKGGKYIAREFEVQTSSNGLRPGEQITDLIDMLPPKKWQRERALKNVKAFTGAVLKMSPNKVSQAGLEGTVGPESPLLGQTVEAIVTPDKNPDFYVVKYRSC